MFQDQFDATDLAEVVAGISLSLAVAVALCIWAVMAVFVVADVVVGMVIAVLLQHKPKPGGKTFACPKESGSGKDKPTMPKAA